MDAEEQALQDELLALKAQINAAQQPASTGYGVDQFIYDVPVGVARAASGLADIGRMALTPFQAAASYQPSYTEQLTKALAPVAEYFGVEPETKVQKAVEFMTPLPGPGKVRILGDVAMGGLGYLGGELGQKYFPESPGAQLALTLGTPALSVAGLSAVKAGARSLSAPAQIALGREAALQEAAQAEVLRQAGPEGVERLRLIQEMPELATGTGGVPLTAAEIVQTPTLAQYQQDIGKKAGATDVLGAAREARGIELQAALERFGVTPEAGDFATALRDAAEESAKKKAASEGDILRSLGLTEEAAAVTKGERGATLREAISKRFDDATELADEAWAAAPKQTKLDVSGALQETLNNYGQFGDLAKASISGEAKRVIDRIQDVVTNQGGIATLNELQDIRSAAGRAMTEAAGKNPTQAGLMGILRDNIDNYGISYLPSAGADTEALTKLSKAIEATRKLKQTFGTDVVGQITATRRYKPKLQTSKVIDRAVANPENASDIINKFGRNSVEATELRLEMLARLDKAKNPTEFIGRNKDTLKAIFDTDYSTLTTFAQQKGKKTGLEQFAKISDTQIPNKIFADVKQANAFMERFKGTEIEQYARAKFIKTKLTKTGNAVANLQANKKIAQRLFGGDYSDLEKVIADLELSKAPGELAKAASKGQSITSQSLTSLGAIAASRGVIGVMKQGALPSSIVGGFGGGWLGATAGLAAGAALRKTGQAREMQMDKFVAEILANPSLIKFAAAPPTNTNIDALVSLGQRLGFLEVKADDYAKDDETLALEAELETLKELVTKRK